MALSEIIAKLGFQLDDKNLKKASTGVEGFMGKLRTLGGVLAGGMIVRGAVRFINDLTTEADQLAKTAKQLDVSSSALQRWQIALRFSGGEATDLNTALRKLAKLTVDASDGLKEAKDSFDKLGIEMEDSEGEIKNIDSLLKEVGLALGKHENATERAALAQEFFGRSGLKLLPMFADGEKGLDKLLKKLDEFGGGLREDLLPLAEDTRDRLLEWEIATNSLKSRLVVSFLPAINQTIAFVSKWTARISKATEGTSLWSSALLALAAISLAPLLGALKMLLVTVAPILIKFAILVLIIDDLVTFFTGGESLIGKGLDKLFGKGTANEVQKALKGIYNDLNDRDWEGAFGKIDKALESTLGKLGEELVVFAVEDIPELSALMVRNFISTSKKFFTEKLSEWGTAIVEGFKANTEKLLIMVKDLASDIVDGLIKGLTGGTGKVVDAFKGLIGMQPGGVFDQARDWLQSKSPSKKAQRLTSSIPEGVVKALNAGKGDIAIAFKRMLPEPLMRSTSIRQTNYINTQVQGGPTGISTGQAVGRSVGDSTRRQLNEAASALIAMA